MKHLFLFLLFLLPVLLSAQDPLPANPRKLRLGYQTDGEGIVLYGSGVPSYTPTRYRSAFHYMDTTNNIYYQYNRIEAKWDTILAGAGAVADGVSVDNSTWSKIGGTDVQQALTKTDSLLGTIEEGATEIVVQTPTADSSRLKIYRNPVRDSAPEIIDPRISDVVELKTENEAGTLSQLQTKKFRTGQIIYRPGYSDATDESYSMYVVKEDTIPPINTNPTVIKNYSFPVDSVAIIPLPDGKYAHLLPIGDAYYISQFLRPEDRNDATETLQRALDYVSLRSMQGYASDTREGGQFDSTYTSASRLVINKGIKITDQIILPNNVSLEGTLSNRQASGKDDGQQPGIEVVMSNPDDTVFLAYDYQRKDDELYNSLRYRNPAVKNLKIFVSDTVNLVFYARGWAKSPFQNVIISGDWESYPSGSSTVKKALNIQYSVFSTYQAVSIANTDTAIHISDGPSTGTTLKFHDVILSRNNYDVVIDSLSMAGASRITFEKVATEGTVMRPWTVAHGINLKLDQYETETGVPACCMESMFKIGHAPSVDRTQSSTVEVSNSRLDGTYDGFIFDVDYLDKLLLINTTINNGGSSLPPLRPFKTTANTKHLILKSVLDKPEDGGALSLLDSVNENTLVNIEGLTVLTGTPIYKSVYHKDGEYIRSQLDTPTVRWGLLTFDNNSDGIDASPFGLNQSYYDFERALRPNTDHQTLMRVEGLFDDDGTSPSSSNLAALKIEGTLDNDTEILTGEVSALDITTSIRHDATTSQFAAINIEHNSSNGTGTLNSIYGINIEPFGGSDPGFTFGNNFGIRVRNQGWQDNKFNNAYALYLDSQTSGAYAIWSNGGRSMFKDTVILEGAIQDVNGSTGSLREIPVATGSAGWNWRPVDSLLANLPQDLTVDKDEKFVVVDEDGPTGELLSMSSVLNLVIEGGALDNTLVDTVSILSSSFSHEQILVYSVEMQSPATSDFVIKLPEPVNTLTGKMIKFPYVIESDGVYDIKVVTDSGNDILDHATDTEVSTKTLTSTTWYEFICMPIPGTSNYKWIVNSN